MIFYHGNCGVLYNGLMTLEVILQSAEDLVNFGWRIGSLLQGGETLELIGDIGAGKTTLTKGLALGLQIDDEVQSPTFTISRNYEAADGLRLAHYDFYRLPDAGIMKMELDEAIHDSHTITVIEWSDVVNNVLPTDVLQIVIQVQPDDSRQLTFKSGGEKSRRIVEKLR